MPGGTDGGTIYLTTADRWGNMVSLVHSVFSVYGSRATVGPYGFVLHNRGSAFSLDPKSPNVVAPRKRPFHSIIAGFVMKDGAPLMAFGNMGGSVQPETHAQHMVNLIDHGMNVQMTTDAARFTHNQTSNMLSLEHNLFALVGKALETKGHQVRGVDGGAVGGYQGILFTRDPRMPEPIFDRRSVTEDHAGERRLSRRVGPSQGRPGGGLVVSGSGPGTLYAACSAGSATCGRSRPRHQHIQERRAAQDELEVGAPAVAPCPGTASRRSRSTRLVTAVSDDQMVTRVDALLVAPACPSGVAGRASRQFDEQRAIGNGL